MLFLIFFPAELDMTSSTASLTSTAPPKRRDALIVGVSTLSALLAVGIASLAMIAIYPHHTQTWANILGAVSTCLSTIQYLPQIWYTFRLGDIKSLSVGTMMIQVPGAFVFAFSLWLRVGWEGWSTWLVYIITGFLQGTLLALAISYWLARRRAGSDADGLAERDGEDGMISATEDAEDEEEEAHERSELLNGNGGRNGTARCGTARKDSTRNGPARAINASARKGSNRQLDMLYSATPPEHDSDTSEMSRK
jgi:uncharacterized protein with PQ loop repeat